LNNNFALSVQNSPSIVCADNSVTITASGANSYTWTNSGRSGPTIVITPRVTNNFTVSGTNNSCVNTLTYTQIVDLCTDLQKWEAETKPIIYPNPATEFFTVITKQYVEEFKIQIIDLTGKIVKDADLDANKSVSISGLVPL
jgi:hypothetical protein